MFSRLYRRGERKGRSQLEDYLTEVFASLFDRLDESARRSLLHSLMHSDAREPFDTTFRQIHDANLDTQMVRDESGRGKRPDMVLRRGGRDILVIEAKLGGAIARHVDHAAQLEEGVGPATVSQLHTYSTWIAGRNATADGWPGAVVLLTAWTAPPKGFPSEGAVFETVRTWTHVAAWLNDKVGTLNPVPQALARDLIAFLREKQLLDRHFSARDLAAYTLYATSEDALRHTFRKTMEAVAAAYPDLGDFRHSAVGNDGEWRSTGAGSILSGSSSIATAGFTSPLAYAPSRASALARTAWISPTTSRSSSPTSATRTSSRSRSTAYPRCRKDGSRSRRGPRASCHESRAPLPRKSRPACPRSQRMGERAGRPSRGRDPHQRRAGSQHLKGTCSRRRSISSDHWARPWPGQEGFGWNVGDERNACYEAHRRAARLHVEVGEFSLNDGD